MTWDRKKDDIVSVLFLPKDMSELMKDGPCGYRPPRMERFIEDGRIFDWKPCDRGQGSIMGCRETWKDDYQLALVLAWKGKILGVGCFLLDRQDAEVLVYGLMKKMMGLDDPRLRALQKKGAFLCLDGEGKEVTPISPTMCSCYLGCEEDDDWHQHRDDLCPVHPNRTVK